MGSFTKIVEQTREVFATGKTRSLEFRKSQLKALLKMYTENENEFADALAKDLRKPRQEAILLELNVLKDDIEYIPSRLDKWSKPETVPASLVTIFDKSVIYHDPLGVVLIMGAWNYPLQLPLLPMSGAIGAGNCVILKPSEISVHTAALIEKLMKKYLDQDCYKVVQGGILETTELLKEKFDYIFYTGSTQVGKIVRDAANKHLTPTTLELGGKSPVYIDSSVNMDIACRRILWGKCINSGQTCVAPDYLLCTKNVQDQFISKAKEVLKQWYGDDAQQSPDLCRIINDRHFGRLCEYLKEGEVAVGGSFNAADRWIEPTILVNVSPKDKVMTDEIFGPILPIITVDSASEAIQFINSRPPPLALYIFSSERLLQKQVINDVKCGTICINDTVVHIGIPALPFGGVGSSGMGAYHGKASFDTFTHRKSCLIRNYNRIGDVIGANRYPPYTEGKINFLKIMLKERSLPSMSCLGYVVAFGLGAISLYAGQEIAKNGFREFVNQKGRSFGNLMSLFSK